MIRAAIAVTLLLLGLGGAFGKNIRPEAEKWDGSRTTPVHKFALFDENADEVVATFPQAMPVSTRNTCGGCHDYTTVSQGWHFSSSSGKANAGRPGEPWMLVDVRTGTQLPLSYRGWKGMWKPADAGLSSWDFTRVFSRHLPGGDMAETLDDLDPDSRWDLSGRIEVNCLGCHNAAPDQDMSEWARQTSRENFRWAATAAGGLGDVVGMASRMPNSWNPIDGPNKDDSEYAVAPAVQYHTTRFDKKQRVVLDLVHQPPDRNCLNCHSVTPVEANRMSTDRDVHLASGLGCADCHRNTLDHQIVRGYEGEKDQATGKPVPSDYTCRGCHIGQTPAGSPHEKARLGAPVPKHAGIPPVHFDRISCTACHSGPVPQAQPVQVRTSRANRVGIHGRAQWFTEAPYIVEPVFIKDATGLIAPHRMTWPAFWAQVDGGKVTPILPEKVLEAGKGILDAPDQIAAVLTALAGDVDTTGAPVLVSGGKIISFDDEGQLRVETAPAAVPTGVTWAWRDNGRIGDILPSCDAAAEKLESDAEVRMLKVIDLLSPVETSGEIVIAAGNRMVHKTFEGTIETTSGAAAVETTAIVRLRNGRYEPLVAQSAIDDTMRIINNDQPLTEDQVAAVLKALDQRAAKGAAGHGYISSGLLFTLGADGKLKAAQHAAAEPVAWHLGHDVRPAEQSLGRTACTECHSPKSPFLFGKVKSSGPLQTAQAVETPMHVYEKLSATYETLFGLSFELRPFYKAFLFAAAGIIMLVLAAFALDGTRRLCKSLGVKE